MARSCARRGDAGADRRLPRRAAGEGRDRRRDRRLCRGDARARACRLRRRARPSSTSSAPAATARARSTSRPPPRSSPPPRARCGEAREPRGELACGLGGRARGARHRARAAARRGRAPRSTSSASASCSRRRSTPRCTRRGGAAELGMRTVFNLLGPLANPAGARTVSSASTPPRSRRTIARRSPRSARGARSSSTATAARRAVALRADLVCRGRRRRGPRVGARSRSTRDLPGARRTISRGGTPADNAAILRACFAGEQGAAPRRGRPERVPAHSSRPGLAADLGEASTRRAAAIDSGLPTSGLERLVALLGRGGR